MTTAAGTARRASWLARAQRELARNKYVYLMSLPVIAYYILFHYIPMYGVTIAFQDFDIAKGFFGSKWVGFTHFIDFFDSYYFGRIVGNTIVLSLYQLIFGFPLPIVLAILLNEVRSSRFKKAVQTVSYLPHFISMVVMCGIIIDFFGREGVVTRLFTLFGMEPKNMLVYPEYFRAIYVGTGIWQGTGWGSIVYISALSTINRELYEAATVDGAGRFAQMVNVTLPGIAPTIVTMFILNVGRIMSVGAEKIILLYNDNTLSTADVIASYVYRFGLGGSFEFSYTTAIGMFSSVINILMLTAANMLSRRINQVSLW